MAELIYSINGIKLSDLSIYVESSEGVMDMLVRKPSIVRNWEDYHGEQVDLSEPVFQPRNIVLNCNLIAADKENFYTLLNTLKVELEKPNLQRLMIDYLQLGMGYITPLVYEVYLTEGISVDKRWQDGNMYGRFSLRLREPEPVKRVIRFAYNATASIQMTSTTPLNIYWGDGTKTLNQKGTISLTHAYPGGMETSDKYAVITGMIEKITGFTHNGLLIWSKLQ